MTLVAGGARRRAVMRPEQRVGYVVFGVGVGGLADGFVLHQLLQWHHLWSSRTPDDTVSGLERNTLADGIFHTAMLVVLLVGVVLIVGERAPLGTAVGLTLVGWGLFHVVDQLVFHLALGAHDIREGVANPEVYNWSFFAAGLALFVAGVAFARSSIREHGRSARST